MDPIPMRLTCPGCGALHIDKGDFAAKPHHTHACQSCGMVWRPAVVATVGVQFLPGFKNDTSSCIVDSCENDHAGEYAPCPLHLDALIKVVNESVRPMQRTPPGKFHSGSVNRQFHTQMVERERVRTLDVCIDRLHALANEIAQAGGEDGPVGALWTDRAANELRKLPRSIEGRQS